jgi:ABC-type uncharacterized transport system permease subunit
VVPTKTFMHVCNILYPQCVYNRALYTCVNFCTYKLRHLHWKTLQPLCSRSGYWPGWHLSCANCIYFINLVTRCPALTNRILAVNTENARVQRCSLCTSLTPTGPVLWLWKQTLQSKRKPKIFWAVIILVWCPAGVTLKGRKEKRTFGRSKSIVWCNVGGTRSYWFSLVLVNVRAFNTAA